MHIHMARMVGALVNAVGLYTEGSYMEGKLIFTGLRDIMNIEIIP